MLIIFAYFQSYNDMKGKLVDLNKAAAKVGLKMCRLRKPYVGRPFL